MKKQLFIGLILLAFTANAQVETNSATAAEWSFASARKIVKWTPFDFFSVIPTLGLDVEVEMANSTAIQFGAAYVPPGLQISSSGFLNNFDRMGGYRLRGEGRIYFSEKSNHYVAASVSVRHLIIRDEITVGMEPFEGEFGQQQFAYFKNIPAVFNRFNTNIDFKWGIEHISSKRAVVDFYAGISVRSIRVFSPTTLPDGGSLPRMGGMWRLEDGHRAVYPIPVIGIRVGLASKP